jgi:hypothetical protein
MSGHAIEVHVLAMLGAAVAIAIVLAVVPAPYGRHARPGWGPSIPVRAAWIAMEAPAAIVFAAAYLAGPRPDRPAALACALLWESHYLYRAFVYPFRLRVRPGSRTPLVTAVLGTGITTWAGWLVGTWLSTFGDHLDGRWLADPRFVAGVVLFAVGTVVHRRADAELRRLRLPGHEGYAIPRGGLFRLVSSPNYLGEIVTWVGFALASWSPAAAAFAALTAANLVPRAVYHHRWYRATFPNYPRERRALVPWLL